MQTNNSPEACITKEVVIDNETKDILNDIAMSLRIISGRSKVTNVKNKNTYKDFYFSQSDE